MSDTPTGRSSYKHGAASADEAIATASADAATLPTEAVLAAIPDAAVLTDTSGRILAYNALAARYFGAALNISIASILRAPEFHATFDLARRTRTRATTRVRLVVPVERHLSIVVALLPERSSTGPDKMLVVASDETEAHLASEMRADFIANASHELRTPLASLKGFIETLQGAAHDDAEARDRFLAIMSEQAQRMTHLIDDLLSLNRIEMRQHVAPNADVNLVEVATATCAALQPLAQSSDQTLTLDVPSEPVFITADHDELSQVAHNLAQNALKYGTTQGRTVIGVTRTATHATLSVSDNGIGIAREHIPRLTERFYRVSAKASRARGGTGLGLAIVKHILIRHGSALEVTSELGRGSRFSARFKLEKR